MNFQNYQKLYRIFDDKNWHEKKDFNTTVFDNFCQLLSNLTDKQQELIIELTERYEWLTLNEYNSILIKLFDKIPESEISNTKKIIFFPIIKSEDEDKTKSGHVILYLMRIIKPLLRKFGEIDFKEAEKFEYFSEDFTINDNEYIYLLDDFLGSGLTLDSTLKKFDEMSIPIEKIRIITIASHVQAIEYMNQKNIVYYTEIISKKGISEYYTDDTIKAEKIEIMKQIEKLLPTKKYNFGFGKSEALITLARTPNNTFPIFWHKYIKEEKSYEAPFSRF